ncbi:MAG: ABC transporter ATP-binding protein [Campylobacter sp.]|nr:ABC transporter ATP-binding protein [Campylobacter sp.]
MIKINGVSKLFNEGKSSEFKALEDINFNIKRGETFFLKGISGSGKSTLLGLIAGLYKPTKGSIIVDGVDITQLSIKFASKFRRENLGIIFQNFNLIPTLSVLDNILIPTLPERKDAREFGRELLNKFHLSSKEKTLVKSLSGGEQQRVAIIRALINDPKIILADEPTANLDAALSKELLVYFKEMKGRTIVISTHDPFLLESGIADEFYDLRKEHK